MKISSEKYLTLKEKFLLDFNLKGIEVIQQILKTEKRHTL